MPALAMVSTPFHVNRPVHLARRDACFERAVELLYLPIQNMDTAARVRHVELILTLINTSERHAFYAVRALPGTQQEKDFLHFLKLISDNVNSVLAMMRHQLHLEAEESFLSQFLATTREQSLMPALHYQRRAEDILQGLWHVLRLAHSPYRSLQRACLEAMDGGERDRYNQAYTSFRSELIRKPEPAQAVKAEPRMNAK
jgi:hypothetical protein